MPDTKRKRELTYSAAVAKLRALEAAQEAEMPVVTEAALNKLFARYQPKFAAVLARVPEKVRAAVAEEAGVSLAECPECGPVCEEPEESLAARVGASYGRELAEEDPAPVYTAERMQSELSPERKKIAGMK